MESENTNNKEESPRDENLTIKERREKKRQEKLERMSATPKKGGGRFFLWFFVIIILAAVVFTMGKLAKNEGGDQGQTSTILESINESDWIKGNEIATTTLVEYSDFECPACRAYHPIVKQIMEDRGEKVKFVYRHFPLPQHQNARMAARAAEAAGIQGKFWEMHDKIFENQDKWAGKPDADKLFSQLAAELSLDLSQFEKDLRSKEIGDKIDSQYREGVKYGIQSTPTFFINNTKYNFSSFDDLKKTLNEALDGNISSL